MGLPNGVHHLAIATRDIKAQIEFFTAGGRHGARRALLDARRPGHGARLSPTERHLLAGVRAGTGDAGDRAGAGRVARRLDGRAGRAAASMQHVALNVDSEADLLALRDRLRSHGYWVHGADRPRHVQVDVPRGAGGHRARVRDLRRADRRRSVDRSGGGRAVRHRRRPSWRATGGPPAFAASGGDGPATRPARRRPELFFSPEAKALLSMSDGEIAARLSFPVPPVPKRAAS